MSPQRCLLAVLVRPIDPASGVDRKLAGHAVFQPPGTKRAEYRAGKVEPGGLWQVPERAGRVAERVQTP